MKSGLNDNILSLINKTPVTILTSIAERVKQRRLELNWTQNLLASKAGMPIATYRRFETTGEVSLRGLILIAIALGMEDDCESLFSSPAYKSVDDLLNTKVLKKRKRGIKDE